MSYVSDDSSLWFNLAGVVAAYQPVRAPGPMAARYNQAIGGTNTYKIASFSNLTWSSSGGWLGAGAVSATPTITIPNNQTYTAIVRVRGLTTSAAAEFWADSGVASFAVRPVRLAGTSDRRYVSAVKSVIVTSGAIAAGVMGFSGRACYLNGSPDGTMDAAALTTIAIYPIVNLTGYALAMALYARQLSAAEMWSISRQMAYCNVNPDWSAWGRRRQWFYLAPSFLAAWASRNNQYIGPGQGTSL